MNPDILFFFEGKPTAFALYQQLEAWLLERFPGIRVKVSKTQISFANRYLFAMASLPKRKKEDHLIVSFGLGCQKVSPRIFSATEAAPRRWTHHVAVRDASGLDSELYSWLEEAYIFSAVK